MVRLWADLMMQRGHVANIQEIPGTDTYDSTDRALTFFFQTDAKSVHAFLKELRIITRMTFKTRQFLRRPFPSVHYFLMRSLNKMITILFLDIIKICNILSIDMLEVNLVRLYA